MTENVIILFLAGAFGALAKDIFTDNSIQLPKIKDGVCSLGFLGGLIIGGAAGYYVDGSYITAFMAGLTGSTLIAGLMSGKTLEVDGETEEIKATITRIAKEESVDPDLALRVAKCESSFNPKAVNVNTDGSRDRGVFQINEKYHPEMTDELAFNVECATRFFCKAFKGGNLSWWNASKTCWDK